MGADVYLRSIYEPNHAKHRAEFDKAVKARKSGNGSQEAVSKAHVAMYSSGYFRDCYNSYGLFANPRYPDGGTLSWWRDVSAKMLDGEGQLSVANAKKLLARVRAAKIDLASARQVAKERHSVANTPWRDSKVFACGAARRQIPHDEVIFGIFITHIRRVERLANGQPSYGNTRRG